ncbi:MAG TPA: hypothetical protein QGH10_10150 [Armatimonadota bacterium]|nr:hypothetical protein [Armatimonadota bacterium]
MKTRAPRAISRLAIATVACLVLAAGLAPAQGLTIEEMLGDGDPDPTPIRDWQEEMKVADSIRAAMAEAGEELGSPGGQLQGDYTWAGYNSTGLTIVVYLKNSREAAAEEWNGNEECRTIQPALPHRVKFFRHWNATYTGGGLLNWVEGRFRIHFNHRGQTDLD